MQPRSITPTTSDNLFFLLGLFYVITENSETYVGSDSKLEEQSMQIVVVSEEAMEMPKTQIEEMT